MLLWDYGTDRRGRGAGHPPFRVDPAPWTGPWGTRHRRGLAIIGYVKTHHRQMLASEHWVRVPELTAGERFGPLRDEGRPLWLLPARGRPR
ncbi:MAG: hypothetical protein OXQ90_00470, partial [Gammaproteobacteria bacterium]|nr:hypothetical protein [Gammaproteobacteria bacterium]